MSNILSLIGRKNELFEIDITNFDSLLSVEVEASSFLVLGGSGSIGQAVTKEIFKRNPQKLHVVDISENNMVELVRDIRSSFVILMVISKHLLLILALLNMTHLLSLTVNMIMF